MILLRKLNALAVSSAKFLGVSSEGFKRYSSDGNARFTVWITFKHSIKTDMLAINYRKVIYDECKIFGKKYDDSISIIITSGTIHDIEELIKEIRDAIRKVYFI